ncbi:MAG TPA: penicillin-binding protein 2 [Syntrophothermus lipocalidus]|nr:penicillin-binding protein 2 [Syntrophothermus lipocalidus]
MDKNRCLQLMCSFLGVYLGLGGVLFYYQVLQASHTAGQTAEIHSRTVGLRDIPRGDILDRNGVPLTGKYTVWGLYGWPQLVKDPRHTTEELAARLGWDDKEVAAVENRFIRGQKEGQALVLLKLPVARYELDILERSPVDGVNLLPVQRRYGDDGFACHLLGEVKLKEDLLGAPHAEEWSGVSGVEKRYDEVLRRVPPGPVDEVAVMVDARGNPIPGIPPKVRKREDSGQGNNVVLTVDQRLQEAVEKVMDRRVQKGAVVVMDVASRDILAMASRPKFRYDGETEAVKEEKDSPFLNRALALYHPGSVFKLVVAAAALEAGVVSVNDTWNCTGSYAFDNGVSIGCWKKEGHGWLNLAEGLANSCNSVLIQVGLKLGREKLLDYVQRLRVTDTEIIGYPGVEPEGYVRVEPGSVAMGNASIGQEGVMLSPVQVASLVATIADDGRWTAPRLVKGIRRADGRWEGRFDTLPKERVISSKTARQLKAMLELAVKSGTGKQGQLKWTGSAGKTASSQTGRFDQSGKEILDTWFAGYLPTENPRWVIVVLVENGISGGQTAAPVFREIGEALCGLSGI